MLALQQALLENYFFYRSIIFKGDKLGNFQFLPVDFEKAGVTQPSDFDDCEDDPPKLRLKK